MSQRSNTSFTSEVLDCASFHTLPLGRHSDTAADLRWKNGTALRSDFFASRLLVFPGHLAIVALFSPVRG